MSSAQAPWRWKPWPGAACGGRRGWGWMIRMRWGAVLVMTGVGFTLGLLCSLLLQLPASSPPANAGGGGPGGGVGVDPAPQPLLLAQDLAFRSRRSFSAVSAVNGAANAAGGSELNGEGENWPAGNTDTDTNSNKLFSHRSASAKTWEKKEREKEGGKKESASFRSSLSGQSPQPALVHSAPNLGIRPDPFVQRLGADNREWRSGDQLTSRPADRKVSGAEGRREEEGESGVKRAGQEEEKNKRDGRGDGAKAEDGDKGYVNSHPGRHSPSLPSSPSSSPPPSANGAGPENVPIKSFTVRLKNTGNRFVVHSAVSRPVEDEDSEHLLGTNQSPPPSSQPPTTTSITNTNTLKSSAVTGARWSRELEDACPGGFDPEESRAWRARARTLQVVRVEEGCGRMQNRLVTFSDGSRACARYRFNTDQVQGEVYSYYLAHLLNMTSRLPPALLTPVSSLSPQWRGVHLHLSTARWQDGRPVVLNRWIDDLTPSYIPPQFRGASPRLHPHDVVSLTGGEEGGRGKEERKGKKRVVEELCDLLQWSDLIVFDYLTANLDRLVNNLVNSQWNSQMMSSPAHNLERTLGGSLVFLDNESGLFHGYRLLEKYRSYHETVLASLCVFRESTARAVKSLHRSGRVGELLHSVFREREGEAHSLLPAIPEKNLAVLSERLARVSQQIEGCEHIYGAGAGGGGGGDGVTGV